MKKYKAKYSSLLFTPCKIGVVLIPNRFVRSATHDFMANQDGSISERQLHLFRKLALGEVGLIITGHAFVNPQGRASPFQIGIHSEEMIEGLRQLARVVHEFPSRIFLQLSHAGRQTKPKICGSTPLAPSSLYDPSSKVTPREMSVEEIKAVIQDFIQAAERAKRASFDGVQLHVAHGYLLSSFISPHTNRRKDDWGGTIFNRVRIVIEIIKGIKNSLGPEFPIIAKINSSDFLPSGIRLEESIEMARLMEKEGLDGVEVSGGMAESGEGSMWRGLRTEDEEGYFVENASSFKKALSIPVLGLGGIRSFKVMEKFIEQKKCDFISMSRPFIREPFLVKMFREGELEKSECISCNRCLNLRGIRCAQLNK